jgi:hypothetical protein
MVSVADRATGPDRGGSGGLHGTRESAGLRESGNVIRSLTACPECGLPAEITDRFSLSSTDGPVEHVSLACVDGHYFRVPADGLPSGAESLADAQPVPPAASAQIGFSRLPGGLGTVANADSGTQHF